MSKKEENIYLITNLIFFVLWIFYMFSFIFLKHTEISNIVNINYITITNILKVLLLLKIIIFDKLNFKRIFMYLLILAIFQYNAYLINYKEMIIAVLFILAGKNIDFKLFIKVDFGLRIGILVSVILLCLTNAIPNYITYVGDIYKQSLGFSHPNILGIHVCTILIEYIFIKKCNLNIKEIIFIIISIITLYIITKSRTSIYALILILILTILTKNKNIFNNKYINKFLILIPILTVMFSFLLIPLYKTNNPFINKLNSITTNRIRSAQEFYDEYGLSLSGKKITLVSTKLAKTLEIKAKILDMAYIHIGIRYGIIILLLFIIIITSTQYYAVKNNNKEVLIANLFFILIGIFETYVFIISINFLLVNAINFLENKPTEITN